MTLTNDNYFSQEATKNYWSVSQFKAFQKWANKELGF